MSTIKINGTFRNYENGTFNTDVAISIKSDAPLSFYDFVDMVESGEYAAYPPSSINFYNDIADIVFKFPEFFEVSWVESKKVGTINLDDLIGINPAY